MFDMLNVKNFDEARRVMSHSLGLLAYLNPGDRLEITDIKFEKLSNDLIYIDSRLDLAQVVDSLEKKRILKFPL